METIIILVVVAGVILFIITKFLPKNTVQKSICPACGKTYGGNPAKCPHCGEKLRWKNL